MINSKIIINILKTGVIINANINDSSVFKSFYISIKLNKDYIINFYLTPISRYFKITGKTNDMLYTGSILKEDYIEYDYLITSRVKEFVSKELEKALLNDEPLPY